MLNYIFWNPNPNAIDLGFFAIKWYGLMWSIGIFAGYFLARHLVKQMNLREEHLTLAIQYIFIGGLVGARLAQVFFYMPEYYLLNPIKILYVWEGGLASHGGIIGAILGLWLFCRKYDDYPFFFALDMGSICFFLFAGLVRMGNLINSEIVGKPTDVPWAFVFYDQVPRHPVVLYEALIYFAMQPVLLWMFHQYKKTKPGIYISFSFLTAFTIRFLLEFLKEPEGGVYFNTISHTQMLSVPFILVGVVFCWFTWKQKWQYGHVPELN